MLSMLIHGTQMHLVTMSFIVLELILFGYQLFYFLSRPQDRQRLWYLYILILLIQYNLANGLFPDANFSISLKLQYVLADGIGYLMGAYLPFYFYKVFDMINLRFYATYGVLLFLVLPFVGCEVVAYYLNGCLLFDRKIGVMIPFAFGLVVLTIILKSIRAAYLADGDRIQYIEKIIVWLAILPWLGMAVFAFIPADQDIKIVMANIGLVAITAIRMVKSIKYARKEYALLRHIDHTGIDAPPAFIENCKRYGLTEKEMEVAGFIRQGWKNRAIADQLFRSEETIKKHLQNIFKKTGVTNRSAVIHLLEYKRNLN
jgi:DNA-binding CsgD family transcriptional regulator